MSADPQAPPAVADRLHFTDSDEANVLLVREPLALLIGFALDQQVTVQKAFMGPLVLRERVGTLDAAALAAMDLEPAFRERPAIAPGKRWMAGRSRNAGSRSIAARAAASSVPTRSRRTSGPMKAF